MTTGSGGEGSGDEAPLARVELTQRFGVLVSKPETDIGLDEGALLIAAHAHPLLDVAAQRCRIDALAESCPSPSRVALVEHLYTTCGFSGDRRDYYNPRNSFLDDVLDRRLGIPITLAVVVIEVARRLGLELSAVGMPGHFLVGAGDERWLDPFDEGRLLDREGARALFAEVNGPNAPFDDSYLLPVGPRAVLARVLANLQRTYRATGDLASVAWVLHLASLVPGAGTAVLAERARVELGLGHYDEAASSLDELAVLLDETRKEGDAGAAQRARAEATRLRARLN